MESTSHAMIITGIIGEKTVAALTKPLAIMAHHILITTVAVARVTGLNKLLAIMV
jgi:folylpolyglutamate synthase/dihydropteroate synthase